MGAPRLALRVEGSFLEKPEVERGSPCQADSNAAFSHETLSETALETEIGCVSTGKKLLQKSSWTTYYHCQVLEKA